MHHILAARAIHDASCVTSRRPLGSFSLMRLPAANLKELQLACTALQSSNSSKQRISGQNASCEVCALSLLGELCCVLLCKNNKSIELEMIICIHKRHQLLSVTAIAPLISKRKATKGLQKHPCMSTYTPHAAATYTLLSHMRCWRFRWLTGEFSCMQP
jgi:hypothetical protein